MPLLDALDHFLHQVVGDPDVEPEFYGVTTPEEMVSLAVNQGILIGADDFRALLRSGSTQYWIACGDPSNPIRHLQKSLASDTRDTKSSAFLDQAEIGARQRLCPSIPLRLLLKQIDRLTNLRGIFPTGAGALLEHPPTRGTNTKAEFCI